MLDLALELNVAWRSEGLRLDTFINSVGLRQMLGPGRVPGPQQH